MYVPSKKLTYPNLGKEKIIFKSALLGLLGDMYGYVNSLEVKYQDQ